ncbi:cysteine--tRNA ligase [Bernardetia sp. MNP-M8]|uniref:cysteine--tRNA ligase n=1 Tax=Bernardetia sp. MNP-M8 TaxID=3127470 RepID=UPI0030D24964
MNPEKDLLIYNTLTRKREKFEPLNAPFVGMYVCGPTVYNDVHLGNCRTFTFFDVVYRYLSYLGYKVRYVRNITDVGHLTGDSDEGDDKISKQARLEQIEPMEVVQRYTNGFHDVMLELGNIPPSIEPTATGHLLEQIEMVQKILKNGFAYESNGSVYFDVVKYNESHNYGKLSGRNIEEQLEGQGTRKLDGQEEKKNSVDFAIWKNADPSHLMQWDTQWGKGFPGWHLECSVMSTKYLGDEFDIHGGGMDLQFPHHECEIAQAVATTGKEPVKYWLHSNMLTMNGTKMSKSLGNVIMPDELFTGNSELLTESYSPMVFRFFMFQTHYRSTMDITDDALKAAKKGYFKLMNGIKNAKNLEYPSESELNSELSIEEKQESDIQKSITSVFRGINDDFNTAKSIAALFNLVKKINMLHAGQLDFSQISKESFDKLKSTLIDFTEQVLGIKEELPQGEKMLKEMIATLVEMYKEAKEARNYEKVDYLRSKAKEIGIVFKDMKDRIDWAYEE